MKFTNYGKLNKIAKGTLAIVLAGSFTFSATQAFADTNTDQNSNTPVVDLQSGTTNTATDTSATTDASATTNTGATTDTNTSTQTTEKQDAPSLLPGDFFYFAKLAFEKIQLALSFDKVKDAQLMASFAQERLAEAQALFASGNQDEALKTIQAALENMKNANQIVDPEKEESSSTTDKVEKDDQTSTDQSTSNQANDQTTTNGQTATQDQTTHQEQPAEDKDVQEVKDVLAQNIVALQAALDKVKNPVARAALQKNIDKAYAKLAKKIDKIEEHIDHAKKEDSDKEQNSNEQDQNPATQENSTTATTDTTATTSPTATNDEKGDDQKDNKDVKPVTHTNKVVHHEEKKKEVKVTYSAVKHVQEHPKFMSQMKHNREEDKQIDHEKKNENRHSDDQNENEQE